MNSLNPRIPFNLVASFEQHGLILLFPRSRLEILVAWLFPADRKVIVWFVQWSVLCVLFLFIYEQSNLVPCVLSLTRIAPIRSQYRLAVLIEVPNYSEED